MNQELDESRHRSSVRRTLQCGIASALLLAVTLGAPTTRAEEDTPKSSELLAATLARRMGLTGGLTATQVADRAAATSFEVVSAGADVEAARAAVEQAAVPFAPTLTLSASYTRLSEITPPLIGHLVIAPTAGAGPIAPGTPLDNVPVSITTPLNQFALRATLTVPISDYVLRISQNYVSAKHSERAAELNARAQTLKVRADAKLAYYAWARSRLSVTVAEQTLNQVKLHLHDAQSLFRNGASSSADVLRVESQVAANERLLAQATSLERTGAEQLRTLMHERNTPRWEIGEDLAPALAGGESTDLDSLVARATRDRPEIRAIAETEASLAQQARVARATVFPHLDAFGDVTTADPNQRFLPNQERFDTTWAMGVRLSWSPNEAIGASARGREIEARTNQIAARRGAIVDGLRAELSQAIRAWTDALIAVDTSARSLAASEESYRARRSMFLNQRATSAELLDAELDLLRARLDAIDARIDQRIAKIRLDHATGRDVVGDPT